MRRLIFIIIAIFIVGCATTQKEQIETLNNEIKTEPQTQTLKNEEKTSEKPKVEVHELPEFKKPAPEKPLPPEKPLDKSMIKMTDKPVLINVEAMPLSDFIIYVLGDILKITFYIDEAVKNMKTPLSLKMTTELPPDKVLDIVLGIFEKFDLIVEEKGGALYITKTKPQRPPMDIRIGRDVPMSPADILQVVVLRYIRATEMEPIIRDIYKTGITVKTYPQVNALLLTGSASIIRDVINLINTFDVPYMEKRQVLLLRFTYWQADEFIKQLSVILEGLGFSIAKSSKEPGIVFIPVKSLNSVLVVAPDENAKKYILEWHGKLDVPEAVGAEEKPYVYVPKYSKASDLVESVKRLLGEIEAPKTVEPSKPATPTKPAAGPATGFAGTGFRIAADDKKNIILISASPAQYRKILTYLESLDVMPRQVLLETTIAELTLTDELRYGFEWYIKNRMKIGDYEGTYEISTLGKLGVGTTQGLVYQFIAENEKMKLLFNALARENKINILSSPRLMVLDNQEAVIQIGTDVPIITGETKTTTPETGAVVSTQSVQYRSTGLIVRVKPNINSEGMLTLDISIESSEAQANVITPQISSPIILTRNLKTTVVASTEETIILGGIMSENLGKAETKVPLLGDIPLLGLLFKSRADTTTKTELLIMIRPQIISSADDASRATKEIINRAKWFGGA